jgi:hypothetical protein
MDDMLELHGVDQPKIDLIEEPFTADALAEKLRGILAADETTRLSSGESTSDASGNRDHPRG